MTVRVLVVITLAVASALSGTAALADLLFLGSDIIRQEGHENVTRLMRLRAGGEETGFTLATGGSSGNGAVGRGRGVERRAFAPSFSSMDIEDASLLRIALSVSEPRNRRWEDLILNDLTLRLQDGRGGQAPVTFSTERRYRLHSSQVSGNEGFTFALDADQAAQANAFIAQGFNRITLSASLSRTQGGWETFYAYAVPVPEPSTYVLFVAGLGVVGFAARRRMRG